jgi:hypothetical protein
MREQDTGHVRHWKRAFDEGYDVESPPTEYSTGLTKGQKNWLRRAWTDYFGYIPNAMPFYSEEKGFYLLPSNGTTQWHHVEPQGWTKRVLNNITPDRPDNLVPIDAINHIGKGYKGEIEDTSFNYVPVKHVDTTWANRNWYRHTQGKIGNTHRLVSIQRRELTFKGKPYWNTDFDEYMKELSEQVSWAYINKCPEDLWPIHKKRIKRAGAKNPERTKTETVLVFSSGDSWPNK